jgi:hypothetical protein
LLLAVGVYLVIELIRVGMPARRNVARAGVVVFLVSLAPLLPWTLRNLRTFGEFQPLTPRYANNPGDYVPMGFNRWVKTWMLDYASVEEIYWQVPGERIDPGKLPSRAFDSPQQKQRTLELVEAYNRTAEIDPALDAQFAALAKERMQTHPLRYYLWLPAGRIADMWLRPRTELFPADPRWWEFNEDVQWSVVSVGFGLLNFFYVASAILGLTRGQPVARAGLLILFVLLRSVFLGTLENPETRYTLECYPVVIVLGAAALAGKRSRIG